MKLALTPLWTPEMGHRLKVARMKQGRSQAEFAALLCTPEQHVSQQQVAEIENGRGVHSRITWARLDAVLGNMASYVLIGAYAPTYNENLISQRFWDLRLKHLRKRDGKDPKDTSGA